MANLLDRFNKTVRGSKGSIADYAAVIAPMGDFRRVTDLETILLSWNNILLTPKRSYDHDPNYGCDLYKMIFEPSDSITEEKVKNEILTSLTTYDDRASIKSIDVVFLTNEKGFNIDIKFSYKGSEEILKTTIDDSLYFRFMDTDT